MGKQRTRKGPRHEKAAAGSPSRRGFDWGWVAVGATLLFGVAVVAMTTRGPASPAPAPEAAAPPASAVLAAEIRDPRVGEVEQRFRCPCGRCGGKPLVDCECDAPGGARRIKAAIIAALEAGNDVDAAVAAVAARFPGALIEGSGQNAPDDHQAAENAIILEVAQGIDCPCGNCTLRLVDCTCEHDRGAAEVKAFIRDRARAGRSAAEIIAAFDRVYRRFLE